MPPRASRNNIHQASASYLVWLRGHIPLLNSDLKIKSLHMREDPFQFLRATFYRWSQVFPQVCPSLMNAKEVLGVGDLHVENFGTWRDAEGRLVWGINDFDEVARLPYTVDLVRLATSAQLAVTDGKLRLASRQVAQYILNGYVASLKAGGGPIILAEDNVDLRTMATHRLKDPGVFWRKLEGFQETREPVPSAVRKTLRKALPSKRVAFRVLHRVAGLGSLGRRRFTVFAKWDGANIAREAKELAPSAWRFSGARGSSDKIFYAQILKKAIRCPDPFLNVKGKWIFRRLAPDCSRIELASLPQEHDARLLLEAMGWETANVHLGSASAKALLSDLKKRKAKWLQAASEAMTEATRKDWKDWKS
jgi:uncharacterized protein (DUF2252 family)